MKNLGTILFLGAVASQLGNTDCGQALKDPGFDLWCGDSLCDWKLERGAVNRVPTWNEGDPGVELVGTDVAIEQLSPVDGNDGVCLEFTLIADVAEDADVELNVDVMGDGSVEHTERLPTSNFKPLSYKIAIAGPYAGVRFELAKTGNGRAVLADIGAQTVDDCGGIAPIVPAPAPLGAPCAGSAGCQSGLCGTSALPPPFDFSGIGFGTTVCIACDMSHPCAANQVCGSDEPTSPVRAVPTRCVMTGSHDLGDQCATDAECGSGICNYQTCSTCRTSADCGGGETCGPAWNLPYDVYTPWVCSPDAHKRAHGEPYASDDDCESSSCGGAQRMQCADGRTCASDYDCPFGMDAINNLTNGPCTVVGIQGGTCQ